MRDVSTTGGYVPFSIYNCNGNKISHNKKQKGVKETHCLL